MATTFTFLKTANGKVNCSSNNPLYDKHASNTVRWRLSKNDAITDKLIVITDEWVVDIFPSVDTVVFIVDGVTTTVEDGTRTPDQLHDDFDASEVFQKANSGSGGSGAFADITGSPEDNEALADYVVGQINTAATPSNQVALTDASTIVWDYSLGNRATVTLGGNRTLSVTNSADGDIGMLDVIQDATGSRTLTLTGFVEIGKSISSTANSKSKVIFENVNGVLDWMLYKFVSVASEATTPHTWTALTFPTNTNQTNTGGVITATSGAGGYGNTGLSGLNLAGDGAIRMKRVSSTDENAFLGLNATNSQQGWGQFELGMNFSIGTIYYVLNGVFDSTAVLIADGQYAILERIGTTVKIFKSTDGEVAGATLAYTFAGSFSGTFYIGSDVYGTGKLNSPMIINY